MLGRAAIAALFGLSLVSTASAGVSAYVANAFESSVSVVDVRTGASQATVPVGCDPRDMVAHPDGSRVYVANTCGGDLDAQTGMLPLFLVPRDLVLTRVRRTISVGAGADAVATIKVRRGRAQRRP